VSRIAELPLGTKVLAAAGTLLFVDLFMTWQEVALDFGPGAEVTRSLDAWDSWGLLIGLLTLALLAGVVVRQTNDELAALGGRWELAALVVTALVLVIVLAKSVRDDGSAWASYAGALLASLMTLGACLDWARARSEEAALPGPWWTPAAGASARAAADTDESRPRW
jgi:hypothetical protein